MQQVAIRTHCTEEQIAAAKHLLALTSPDERSSVRLHAKLDDALAQDGEREYYAELPIVWVLMEVCGFYVDWRAADAFREGIVTLAREWGVTVPFRSGADEADSVAEEMQRVHNELEPLGLMLWHWNTQEDNYCGSICRIRDWPAVIQAAVDLGIEAAPADCQFDDGVHE